ncbi:MAG: YunG family protein [Aestuariivirgaceae bacterium]
MTDRDIAGLQDAVSSAWSRATAKQWTADNPAAGQCNVTAIVVQELAGGEILKTALDEGHHFYNRLAGQRHDFTDCQFDGAIDYDDLPSSRAEAIAGVTEAEYNAMKTAVLRHLGA